MKKNFLLSIIITIYNSEKYISRALDSLLNQTNIFPVEIVIIDDGSTDSSHKIISEYVNKNVNIYYYYKNNGGVSSARNMGLEKSKGEYIMFLDSDDWVDNDFFSVIYNYLKPQKYNIIFFKTRFIKKIEKKNEISRKNTTYYLDTKQTIDWFISKKISGFNGDKIYKRKLFFRHNIFFKEGIIHEDLDLLSRIILLSDNNVYVNEFFYNYYIINNSSLTKNYSEKNIVDYFNLNKRIYEEYSLIKSLSEQNLYLYYMSASIYALSEIYKINMDSVIILELKKLIFNIYNKFTFKSKLNFIFKSKKLFIKYILIRMDLLKKIYKYRLDSKLWF